MLSTSVKQRRYISTVFKIIWNTLVYKNQDNISIPAFDQLLFSNKFIDHENFIRN